MKVVDYVVDCAKEAGEQAFKYARAVPEDKLSWVPLEGGRSVMSLVQELAMTPTWQYEVLSGEADWSEDSS